MINNYAIKLNLDVSNIGMTYIESFKIDSTVQNGFINTFNDKNPLHISNEYAQSVGYQSKVMHGNILNGFLSYFVGEILQNSNLALMTQSIRYKHPIYLNEDLNLNVILKDVSVATNMFLFDFEFKNNSEQVVADGKFQCIQLI